jgi:hypothetical protein
MALIVNNEVKAVVANVESATLSFKISEGALYREALFNDSIQFYSAGVILDFYLNFTYEAAEKITTKYIYADTTFKFYNKDTGITYTTNIYDRIYASDAFSSWFCRNEEFAIAMSMAGTGSYTYEVDISLEDYSGSASGVISNEAGGNTFKFTGEFDFYFPQFDCSYKLLTAPNFSDEQNPVITYSSGYDWGYGSKFALTATIEADNKIIVSRSNLELTNTSFTFILTEAERQALRNTVKSGTNRSVVFKLTTNIKASALNENVYSELYKVFTISNAMPQIAPTVEDINAATLQLTGDKNTIIKYYSNVAYSINATASKGATINHQQILCGDKTNTAASGVLQAVESSKFVFTVADTRDNIASAVIDKKLIDYVKLTCNAAKVAASPDGKIEIDISGNYFNGTFGAAENTIALCYRYKENNGNYNGWLYIEPELNGNTYKYNLDLYGFNYLNNYTFEVMVEDELDRAVSAEVLIKFIPVFDWSETDFNFNVPVIYTEEDKEYNITDTIKGLEEVDLKALQEVSGMVKALSNRYELPCEVGAGVDFSSVDCNLYLYGNTIRGYLNCVRNEASGTGDLQNRIVCGVTFDSGGKVVGFGQTSFSSGGKGTVANFSMADTVVYADDGSVDESQVGKGYFNIYLTAAADSDTEWQTFFSFPAVLDLTKY